MPVPSTLTMGLLSRPALHPARALSRSLHYTVGPFGLSLHAESSCTPHPTPIYPLKPEFQLPATAHISSMRPGWEGLLGVPGTSMLVFLYLKDCSEVSTLSLSSLGSSLTVSADSARVMEVHFTAPTQGSFLPILPLFSPSSYSVMWGSFLQLAV